VMPGCLGLDALWQMVGFFLGWTGGAGKGRALGLGDLKFSGQVLPNVTKVMYHIDMKRVMRSKLVLGVADGWLSTDGEIIYRATDLKVGLFQQDATLQAAKTALGGDRGVVDLVGTMGLFQISSMMVALDQTPLAPGTKPYLH